MFSLNTILALQQNVFQSLALQLRESQIFHTLQYISLHRKKKKKTDIL